MFDSNCFDVFRKKHDIDVSFLVEPTLSDSGDDCHFDILNMENPVSRKFTLDYVKAPNFYMCEDSVVYPTQIILDDNFLSQAKADFKKSINLNL